MNIVMTGDIAKFEKMQFKKIIAQNKLRIYESLRITQNLEILESNTKPYVFIDYDKLYFDSNDAVTNLPSNVIYVANKMETRVILKYLLPSFSRNGFQTNIYLECPFCKVFKESLLLDHKGKYYEKDLCNRMNTISDYNCNCYKSKYNPNPNPYSNESKYKYIELIPYFMHTSHPQFLVSAITTPIIVYIVDL